ncbi:hypothetical protein LIER_22988 [Lithospermum erythrorhizon]|uniref:Uncharacterized protein n=1 Tax=Lithospermum erythrorhizon TaxID=34254 RepID=A0AAV3QYV2_LITER
MGGIRSPGEAQGGGHCEIPMKASPNPLWHHANLASYMELKPFYQQRVKNRKFRVGDLMLKIYSASHPKEVNKLSPKWEGPYRVSLILGPSTYELEEMDGKPVPRTWHASKLRKFYC